MTAVAYSQQEKLRPLLQALAQYIHDVNDVIAGVSAIEIKTATDVDVHNVVFTTEDGAPVMIISPDM